MQIETAQRDVRTVFRRGAVGQAVSGIVWLLSAACATWVSPRSGMLVLAIGGMLIFPVTQLGLRLLGGPASLGARHPMNALAMQIAFTVPIALPLVAAAALHNRHWFYPAFMLVVGAHYLPFVFLYGMRAFGILAAVLVGGGLLLGLYAPGAFTAGGWLTGVALLLFAFYAATSREPARASSTEGSAP